MEKFRINFKYATLIYILIGVGVLVGALSLYLNVKNLIDAYNGELLKIDSFNFVSKILFTLLSLLLITYGISLILACNYKVNEKVIVFRIGLLRSKYEISKIIRITHFKKTDSLVVYFNDQTYTVIIISPNDFERFIKTVREIKNDVIFENEIEN